MHSHFVIQRTTRSFALLVLLAACRDKKSPGPTGPDPYPTGSSYDALPVASENAGFSFLAIGDLASTGSPSISADGRTVAGTRNKRAVRWTAQTGSVELGSLPGGDGTSIASGISADGNVIVGSASSSRGTEAFRWSARTGMVGLGDLPGSGRFSSHALGVSADGSVIAGMSGRRWPISRAFRWTAASGLADLGSLPGGDGFAQAKAITSDGTIIVGGSRNAAGIEEAFRWTTSGGMVPLGLLHGHGFTRAEAVAADGNTVVGWGATNAGNEAFRWTPANGVVGLGSLNVNDFASAAFAVSANGNVVTGIGSGAADFNGDAFVWFPGTGMIDLKQYLVAHGITGIEGWKLGYGSSLSADGRTIVGGAIVAAGKPQTWIAQVAIDETPAPPPTVTETIRPASVSFLSGSPVAGGAPQLLNSDNTYVSMRASGRNAMQLSISGVASNARVSDLRLTVEAAASGSATVQEIALFDYVTRTWQTLRRANASSGDASVSVATSDRPSRFIEAGSLRVQARLTFIPSGGKKETTTARVDQVFWTRVP